VELYVDSRDLPDLFETLAGLPKVSIDHLGLTRTGFATLRRLVERGVKVKATGFGRVEVEVAVPEALRQLFDANPGALMFGTDLPSTRAPRPFLDEDVDLVLATLGPDHAAKVFYENASVFYLTTTPARS
jgi:predicted TIM-barrel fold metal-dependent hydrolase